MINWREGKAGFVGASKHWIKGFFRYAYSVTSAVVVPPDIPFAVTSIMTSDGDGINSLMDSTGFGIFSTMTNSHAVTSIMVSDGDGVISTMDTTGDGVESTL